MSLFQVYLTFDLQNARGTAYSVAYAAVGALGFEPITLKNESGKSVQPTTILVSVTNGENASQVANRIVAEVTERLQRAELHGNVLAIVTAQSDSTLAGDVF